MWNVEERIDDIRNVAINPVCDTVLVHRDVAGERQNHLGADCWCVPVPLRAGEAMGMSVDQLRDFLREIDRRN